MVDVQRGFQLTPEALTAPAWFQLARQQQAVQGPPPGHQLSFWGGLKVFPLVGASTHMFHFLYPPARRWPQARSVTVGVLATAKVITSSVWGLVTRLGDGWEALLSFSWSLVLALERFSNSDPVNYVPFLKKADK